VSRAFYKRTSSSHRNPVLPINYWAQPR